MFITLRDVSKGKPLSLNKSIENCKQIGIRTIFMWVGWYNIYKEQSWRWALENSPNNSTEVKIQPGLYSFSDLVEILVSQVEGFTITVNRTNGLINMIIPAGYEIWLPEAIRYLLGLEDDDSIGWLTAGEYEGDHAVEFSPKRLLIYLKQLSTSTNFESKHLEKNQLGLEPSQLLGAIPISSKSFGEYTTVSFDNPLFKDLNCNINELDFDFKIEWANGKRDKLDNHSQPIDLILEIK